jgi:UPF0755 protein
MSPGAAPGAAPGGGVAGRARAVLGVLAVLGGAGAVGFAILSTPAGAPPGESILVRIPRGSAPSQVAAILEEAGVIRSGTFFTLRARLTGASGRLQAGEYEFTGRVSPGDVLRRIAAGEVLLHRLTLPEGLAGPEVVDRIVGLDLAPREDLEAAFAEPGSVRDLDPEAVDLEGYLFPDTYHLPRPAPADRILGEMVARFRREMTEEFLSGARRLGLTVRQVVTLASLIEKETSIPAERRRISAVFHNRLRRGMPLQCDPTVIYALSADGRYRGRLSREDLRYDSPYNTYLVQGLPPGPIASPGRESLEAAIAPLDTGDLYFVADGTGGHHFSRSLDEHLRAVERYRRLLRRGA